METKYRTLLQAAVMLLVLTVLVIDHNREQADRAMAQRTVHAER